MSTAGTLFWAGVALIAATGVVLYLRSTADLRPRDRIALGVLQINDCLSGECGFTIAASQCILSFVRLVKNDYDI